MNRDLYALEERISHFFNKGRNRNKDFSLLFVADIVDPNKEFDYSSIETVLKKLEIEGMIYHNKENDTWRTFPYTDNILHGTIRKNKKGTCLIDMPSGNKYILKPEDAGYLLDGDIITFKPTEKTSGSRYVADLDSIIKRKNGLVVVEFSWLFNGFDLRPISSKINYPISLPDDVLDSLNTGDRLLLKIDELNYAGVLEAEVVSVMTDDMDESSIEEVFNDEDIDELDDVIFIDEEQIIETQEDPDRLSKEEQQMINEPAYDDTTLEVYISNVPRIKAEFQLESYTVQGILNINKYGEGIVQVGGKTYCIKRQYLHNAINGDKVEIRPSLLKSHGKIMSVVENVIKRRNTIVIAEVDHVEETDDDRVIIVLNPLNVKLDHKLIFPKEFDKPLVLGDRVAVTVPSTLTNGRFEAQFVKHIGHKDDPDIDLSSIATEFGIEEAFTPSQIEEAYALPTEVLEEEKIGRLDYTQKRVFSIDGKNTKDRDDALSIEPLDNGNYLVGIHIADVTHYIKPGMALWSAIMLRGTSVYMDNSVIPLLLHILSNGILSLNPDKERLTLSCMVELTPNGDVVSFDFKDVVIKSKKAMVYDEVNEILEENIIPEGYEEFENDLRLLDMLARKLDKKREARGAVNFDDIEGDTEIIRDENGETTEFVSKKQRSAQKLIECLMLLAGECAAEYLILPAAYRVHEAPDEDTVKEAIKSIEKLGVKKVKSIRNVVNGHVLNSIIQSIENQDIRTVAANIILRSMKRARIDTDEEIGHYALAIDRKICRFTSPIRRTEDDIVHLQIRKQRDLLYDPENFEQEYQDDLDWISREAEHINEKQLNAEKAEEAAIQLRMAQYIDKHIGDTFDAKVTFINEEGIWIKTANGVDGKIDPVDFDGDCILYDDNTLTYRGRSTGIVIKIGSPILVTALDTHREYRTINFGSSIQKDKVLVKKGVA